MGIPDTSRSPIFAFKQFCLFRIYTKKTTNFYGNDHTTLKGTASRLISEVKQRRARLVLGWVTAWEHRVSLAPSFLPNFVIFFFIEVFASPPPFNHHLSDQVKYCKS